MSLEDDAGAYGQRGISLSSITRGPDNGGVRTDANSNESGEERPRHPPGVPTTPEEAQSLLFTLLGQAIAQAQIAEGQAISIYQLVNHRNPPKRATLGAKVREIKGSLPADLAVDYQRLVDARNYLAHEVLFDCGGWSGIPWLDPPSKFAALYDAITTAQTTIQRVSTSLNQHLVDAGYPVLIANIGPDRVTPLKPTPAARQDDSKKRPSSG